MSDLESRVSVIEGKLDSLLAMFSATEPEMPDDLGEDPEPMDWLSFATDVVEVLPEGQCLPAVAAEHVMGVVDDYAARLPGGVYPILFGILDLVQGTGEDIMPAAFRSYATQWAAHVEAETLDGELTGYEVIDALIEPLRSLGVKAISLWGRPAALIIMRLRGLCQALAKAGGEVLGQEEGHHVEGDPGGGWSFPG